MKRKNLALLLLGGVLTCSTPLTVSARSVTSQTTSAQEVEFEKYFLDNTLRIDYIFAGNNKSQHIYVDEIYSIPQWAGRKNRLAELPLKGNGQLTVRDAETNQVIYCTSFSSLFQEWQLTEEAEKINKSFENCFLIPTPKKPVNVSLTLCNNKGEVTSELVHPIDPNDILIRNVANHQPTPHNYLVKSGDLAKSIDIVIVAEGYSAADMDKFDRDAQRAVEAFFAHEPFTTYRDRFNIVAVAAPSKDSGVSEPAKNIWKETAVGSHFDTFYSTRYLTTLRLKQLHNLLVGIPYEHIAIIANTDTYGGGGIYNSYTLTSTQEKTFGPVLVHELGHSFGGLADEYYYDDEHDVLYPDGHEPWEQNITTLAKFEDKWQDMLKKSTPIPTPLIENPSKKEKFTKLGVYEGAGYRSKGVYRPVHECRMKVVTEEPGFCPVCQRALSRLITFYTE